MALAEEDREDPFCSYETPYVIWANDAAAELLDWDRAVEALDLPENGTISASFLGATVLELTGRGEQTPWVAFLNELQLRDTVNARVMLPDGTYRRPQDPAEDFPNDQQVQDAILQWRQWSYYHLRYKEIP